MAGVKILELLDGYKRDEDGSRGGFLSKPITGSVRVNGGNRIVRQTKNAFSRVSELFAFTSVRTYGMTMLSMGILTLIIHLSVFYFKHTVILPSTLVIGILFSVLGVALILLDRPIASVLQDFALTDYIFFEFFCLRRTSVGASDRGIHVLFGLLAGSALAVIGYFSSVLYVVVVLVALVYVMLGFTSPEFSFFTTLIAMPYLSFLDASRYILSAMVLVTLISFIAKVILGKRVYYFEQYDAILILFMVFVLASGIFVKGIESFTGSVAMVLLSLGYVLSSSLIANRRLADNMLSSVVISALPMSVYAIVQGVIQLVDVGGFSGYVGVSGPFASSTALAELLLVSGAFCLYFIKTAKSTAVSLGYLAALAVIGIALVMTAVVWVAVAVVIGALAYFCSRMRHGSGILIALLCIVAYLPLVMPADWFKALNDIPVLSRLELYESALVWRASVSMLADNLIVGIGIGAECFAEEAAVYGITGKTNSSNLFLEIGIEAGIFALLAMLLLFAVRLRHRSRYSRFVRDARVKEAAAFVLAATVCLIVLGSTGYLWGDLTVMYLFWCLFGVSGALLRDAKRERDDWVDYFSDVRSSDSSSVDIGLR